MSHPNGQQPADDFLWGVATSAYQSEGGYNGVGEPQTNWATAEAARHVAPVGKAAEFWTRFQSDFALCRDLGLNAFRLSVEWSRVQPTLENQPSAPPPFDYEALACYAEILAECRRAGMEPIVTLHHFVHPAWLGADPWLDAKTPDLFRRYVGETVRHLNRKLIESYALPPIRYYLTINEPNMLVLNTYLGHQFPSAARSGRTNLCAAHVQLMRAHVLAYNRVHDLHRDHAWPTPAVSFNNHCSDVYWSDKLWLDLVTLRTAGIGRHAVDETITRQEQRNAQALRKAPVALRRDLPYHAGALFMRLLSAFSRRHFTSQTLASLLDTIYESPRARLIDYIGIDYYDPFAAHLFRFPAWWDHELKNRSIGSWMMNSVTSKWWDWRVLPRGLHFFCSYYHAEFGLPILIAENGMALRRRPGQAHVHRRDRHTRSEFLRLHLREVEGIRQQGIPLLGYLHWSLFDNYEWGTYTPRFGLYSLDYESGTQRLPEDHLGDRPSETYAQLIAESRQSRARGYECIGGEKRNR